jgi:membrane dipeptidase
MRSFHYYPMTQPQFKPYIIDAHQDLAYNMLVFDRDFSQSVAVIREREAKSIISTRAESVMSGWPEYQKGHVGIVFGTLFATPKKRQEAEWERQSVYADANQAASIYRQEFELYDRFIQEHPTQFAWIRNQAELADVLGRQFDWNTAFDNGQKSLPAAPTGLVLLMEGAEGVRQPSDLEEWWRNGLRIIGPAWAGTRFCGGTREPGPLTDEGRELLDAMDEIGFTLDISHMDEAAVYQALERYHGQVICSHSAPQRLMKARQSNRFLPDEIIRLLIDRDAVIGITAFNLFISETWSENSSRSDVSLEDYANQIDTICQMAGDAHHAGIGSDLDGGFGYQSTPGDMEDVSDLQKLTGILQNRGYSNRDIELIMGLNWLSFLRKGLPEK